MMRVRLSLKPGQPGTKGLLARYGKRLVRVRYRYDEETAQRLKTAEVIVGISDWKREPPPPRANEVVALRVGWREIEVRRRVLWEVGSARPSQVWTGDFGPKEPHHAVQPISTWGEVRGLRVPVGPGPPGSTAGDQTDSAIASAPRLREDWAKDQRHTPMRGLIATYRTKLRGHYNYLGVIPSYTSLNVYYTQTRRILLKWLNHRRQRRSYNWRGYKAMLRHFRLPPPRITEVRYRQLVLETSC